MPHDREIQCPNCGRDHLFMVYPDDGPRVEFCEDCDTRFTIHPD